MTKINSMYKAYLFIEKLHMVDLKKIFKMKIVIFDIDVVGGVNIKKMFPEETRSVFVMPPSLEVLEKRLIDRGDISKDEIRMRIKKAKNEFICRNETETRLLGL